MFRYNKKLSKAAAAREHEDEDASEWSHGDCRMVNAALTAYLAKQEPETGGWNSFANKR